MAQTTEITITVEVTDVRKAEKWLEKVILEQGQDHGISAIVDWE